MARKLVFSITIDDCEIQTFRSSGSGGQNVNKRDTGVRIIHHPSGAVGRSTDERSQLQNKRLAFKRMAETKEFQKWVRLEVAKKSGEKSAEEKVEEMMELKNLKFEIKEDGKWTDTTYERMNNEL